MECFVEVDRDFDGFVRRKDFDRLVESAGIKATHRDQAFTDINKSGTGNMIMDEWLDWCLDVSSGNLSSLPTSPEAVAKDRRSPEFLDHRCFLMECFVEVDRDFDGFVRRKDFD